MLQLCLTQRPNWTPPRKLSLKVQTETGPSSGACFVCAPQRKISLNSRISCPNWECDRVGCIDQYIVIILDFDPLLVEFL